MLGDRETDLEKIRRMLERPDLTETEVEELVREERRFEEQMRVIPIARGARRPTSGPEAGIDRPTPEQRRPVVGSRHRRRAG